MACLFLAAKIEENNKRLRDVLNVFHHLRQKRKGRYVSRTNNMGITVYDHTYELHFDTIKQLYYLVE